MKIEKGFQVNTTNVHDSKRLVNDPFDIDIKVRAVQSTQLNQVRITSVSLCTPGCGNTGTGNSFCC